MTIALRLLPLLALSLAACGPTGSKGQPEAVIGGVNLSQPIRALGNEPFWSATVSGDKLSFNEMGGSTVTAVHGNPEVTGNVAVWSGKATDGTALVLTITGTDCSDGMSDRTYPLTSRVQVGERTFSGCAALEQAIMKAGEKGRVQ